MLLSSSRNFQSAIMSVKQYESIEMKTDKNFYLSFNKINVEL